MPNEETNEMLNLLTGFKSGVLTIGVNGRPLAKIDGETHEIDLGTSGVKESGIKLSKLMPQRQSLTTILKNSETMARGLSDRGWKLTLYDEDGGSILSAGRGVSKLTSYMHVNPLKLGKILELL